MRRTTAAQELADELADLPLFAGCRRGELRRIAARMQTWRPRAGELLLLERHRGEQFHVVVAGTARVTRGAETVAELGRGDFFGEVGMLEHRDRNATVRAGESLHLATLDADGFAALLDDHPDVADRVRRTAAARG